tara:strand:+ start:69 stop:659 length:591 start_codon:yes stop_codon:yes gene_type:complete
MNDQKVQKALKFLSDYVQTNQDQIGPWLKGASRENFGAELILLSLEARKIGEVYDLSGIALGSAMSLFKTVHGGHLAAQKVVAYNTALGEAIPAELLYFLKNPPRSKNQIGPSARYARRDLLVLVLLKYLTVAFGLPKYSSVKKPKKSESPNELQQSTAIGLIQAALTPFSEIISSADLASLERATREFEAKSPWF